MKLIATDMDGTLLNEHGEIAQENIKALHKAMDQGIDVIVATGRSYDSARTLLEAANLSFPIICGNGAEIRSKQGKKLKTVPVHKELTKKVQAICKQDDVYFELFTNYGVYSENQDRFSQEMLGQYELSHPNLNKGEAHELCVKRMKEEEITFVETYESILALPDMEIYKILVFSSDLKKLEVVAKQLETEEELALTSSGLGNIEVNHVNAQKGMALKYMALENGIKLEDIMAIGDNFNDVSMLTMVGRGVAMGNAADEIKVMCDYQTTTNVEHGVAFAIEEMLRDTNK